MTRPDRPLLSTLPTERVMRSALEGGAADADQLLVLSRLFACRTRLLCDVIAQRVQQARRERELEAVA